MTGSTSSGLHHQIQKFENCPVVICHLVFKTPQSSYLSMSYLSHELQKFLLAWKFVEFYSIYDKTPLSPSSTIPIGALCAVQCAQTRTTAALSSPPSRCLPTAPPSLRFPVKIFLSWSPSWIQLSPLIIQLYVYRQGQGGGGRVSLGLPVDPWPRPGAVLARV